MKATASLEKSVAVIIHCELRLEPQGATASTEKPETTRISLGAAPNVEQDTNVPSFASFAETWFLENEVRWKHSYKLTLRSSLNKHILPNFGQQRIDQISRAEVLAFRSHLTKLPGRNKPSLLSPARVNTIMVALRLILNEASLWLASGEQVVWVSQQLGHSDPNTTLRKYAKYAPNLTREDGTAFAELLDQR